LGYTKLSINYKLNTALLIPRLIIYPSSIIAIRPPTLQAHTFKMSTPEFPVFHPGNTAVITGGASGIGLALATKCKNSGMNIVICDNNSDNLKKAKDILAKDSGEGKVESL
jgi:NADPH:quinone reductase-like Zn-dependent oxidoreductase